MWTIVGLLLVGCFTYLWWTVFMQNVHRVPPGDTTWKITMDPDGNMTALGPGTHHRPPGEVLFAEISTNRRPIIFDSKIKEPEIRRSHDEIVEIKDSAEEVRTANDVAILIEISGDAVIGRKIGENGVPEFTPNDDLPPVDESRLKLAAVHLMEKGELLDEIRRILKDKMESVIGHYSFDELFRPEKFRPWIPDPLLLDEPERWITRKGYVIPKQCMTIAAVYRQLAFTVEYLINDDLRAVGANFVGVRISNMFPVSETMRQSLELPQEVVLRAEATAGTDITPREQLAARTPEFGNVAIAESIRHASNQLAEGLKNINIKNN